MKRKVIVTLLTVFTVTAASLTGCGKKQQEQIESQIAAMVESGESEASEVSEEPKVTETPKATATPEPEATATPDVTAKPEMPETTEKPETTDKPDVTASPETTKKPESTKAPESTAKPEATKAPEATKKPEATKAPATTSKPEATNKPETTPAVTPAPVSETKPTATPTPSAEHQHTFAWDWTWTEWGKTCDDPTITYKADVCSECGYKQNVRVVDSHLEHAGPINEINDGERTCTTGCTTTHICTACGEVTKSYTSSPLGHSMDEITGNCRRTGCDYHEHRWIDYPNEGVRYCSSCGAEEHYTPVQHEHQWVDNNDGSGYLVCSVCGESTPKPHGEHQWVNCEEGSYCSVCGIWAD